MDAEARYTLIGAVVITLSVFLTAFGFWLGTNKPESEYNFYTVYFRNQTLDGLQKNSDLTMKGIKVGSVEDFSILDNDVERVRVLVRVLRGIPIKQGAEAVIRRNFLTGLAYIDIRNAKQDASILTERLPGERHPIIAEGRTGLDEIADTIPDLVKDLRRFVSEVLSEENRDSIRLTLANIKEFSEALNKQSGSISALVGNTEQAAHSLNKTFSKIDGAKVASAVEGLDRIVNQSAGLVESLARLTDVLSLQLGGLTRELAVAAAKVSTAAERFENPRSVIVGPARGNLGPGE